MTKRWRKSLIGGAILAPIIFAMSLYFDYSLGASILAALGCGAAMTWFGYVMYDGS